MKLVNRNNFIQTTCAAYTAISLFKIILESISNKKIDTGNLNYLIIFVVSLIATFLLSLHYYLQKYPIWLVITGQYLLLIAIITSSLWIGGHFVKLHADAYKDMFWSVTIPYVVGASVYYLSFLYKVKKANHILKELKSEFRKDVM